MANLGGPTEPRLDISLHACPPLVGPAVVRFARQCDAYVADPRYNVHGDAMYSKALTGGGLLNVMEAALWALSSISEQGRACSAEALFSHVAASTALANQPCLLRQNASF